VRIIYNSTRCPPSPAIPISTPARRPLNSAPLAPYAFLSSIQPPTSSLQNLIVTPELEFPATRRKQNSSSISNRYKTGFWQASSGIEPLVSSLQNLIANPRLKSALSTKDSSDLQISNREPLAIFCCVPRSALPILLATSHSSLATRFPNRDTAINNRNIPHRFSHFQFSNRGRSAALAFQKFQRDGIFFSEALSGFEPQFRASSSEPPRTRRIRDTGAESHRCALFCACYASSAFREKSE